MLSKIIVIAAWFWLVSSPASAGDPLRLVTFEYPPYIKQVDHQAQGLAVDMVNEAFSRMKKPVSIEFYPWARALSMVTSGTADGLFTIKKNPEREISMLFPRKPLISQDYVFFVRKNSSVQFNGDFSSLAKARIGIVNATSYGSRFDEAAKSGQFKALDRANNYLLTFRKLLGGRVDAVICSRLVGLDILKNLNATDKIEISGPPSETTASYLVFTMRKDHRDLAMEFDRTIETLEKDGTFSRLLRKYNLPSAIPSSPNVKRP